MKSTPVFLKVIATFFLFFSVAYHGIAQTDTNLQSDEEVVFTVTEEMPEFPGGSEALLQFFQHNLSYPEDARKDKIEARIIVEFIVERDGSLTNINVIRKHQYESLNNEAIRVIEKMPKWIPAKQRGKVVRCRYIQPIQFRLQNR